MGRQSISFTEPNDEWLKAQVNNKEYSSKSGAEILAESKATFNG